VSGLKVNFFKSKFYGINLDERFLSASSSFLHCGVESIPFQCLGIPVDANPRRRATWIPILDSMKKKIVWLEWLSLVYRRHGCSHKFRPF
jgi:hypothetical protein